MADQVTAGLYVLQSKNWRGCGDDLVSGLRLLGKMSGYPWTHAHGVIEGL
ncbi:MAG: hypothetical protein ACFCD0_16825 [Gemmataceae bacterium]